MSRKIARDIGMRLLYARNMSGEDDLWSILELMEEIKAKDLNDDDVLYIRRIIDGVEGETEQLDEVINKFAVRWKTDRMSKVDLCILRLAIYEMLHEADIPSGVSINEAVELSHTYSSDEAGPFINGILGQYTRFMSRSEKKTAETTEE